MFIVLKVKKKNMVKSNGNKKHNKRKEISIKKRSHIYCENRIDIK